MLPPLLAVVEDDASLRELLDEVFQDEGYRTLMLAQGAGAHQTIRLAQPDVVILDLWLEHRGVGWAVLEELCRDPATCHIPILLCSADTPTLQAQQEQLRELGCSVVAKPFDLAELLEAVRQVISQRQPVLMDQEIGQAAEAAGAE